MVAHGVYEAGFENLRRHLRRRAATCARRAPRRCAAALPLPSRQVRLHAYGGAGAARAGARRGAAAARRRGAHPPARDRRQLHRRLPAPRLDARAAAGVAASPGMPRHGGRRHRDRRRRRRRHGLLPGDRVAYLGPDARRLLQRAHRAGRLGRAPAGGDRRRDRRGAAAQGHHRRLPAARPRPRARRHAAAGACGRRRRRPAGVRAGRAGSAPR